MEVKWIQTRVRAEDREHEKTRREGRCCLMVSESCKMGGVCF